MQTNTHVYLDTFIHIYLKHARRKPINQESKIRTYSVYQYHRAPGEVSLIILISI